MLRTLNLPTNLPEPPDMLRPLIIVFALVVPIFLNPVSGQSLLANLDAEINAIVGKIQPSVVTVSAIIPNKEKGESFFSFLKDSDASQKQPQASFITNVGTGFVLHESGFVVTKSSVVAEAEHIYVQFNEDSSYMAELLGIDSEHSVALLRFEAPNLVPLEFGDPHLLRAGSWTVLVGNSLGISSTVSMGNVNAVYANGLLQIAVNTSPGNNGSPVMNARGQVIGMISGRLTISQGTNNSTGGTECALVTPIDQVLQASRKIMAKYRASHGWLGITVRPFKRNLPQIVALLENSPAARSGLAIGDVIQKINAQILHEYYDLKKIMASIKPGSEMKIHVQRNGESYEFELRATKLPDNPQFAGILSADIKTQQDEPFLKFGNKKARTREQFERRLLLMERKLQSLQNQLRNKK